MSERRYDREMERAEEIAYLKRRLAALEGETHAPLGRFDLYDPTPANVDKWSVRDAIKAKFYEEARRRDWPEFQPGITVVNNVPPVGGNDRDNDIVGTVPAPAGQPAIDPAVELARTRQDLYGDDRADDEYSPELLRQVFGAQAPRDSAEFDPTLPQIAPTDGSGARIAERVMEDIRRKSTRGAAKYGMLLRAHNGRDALIDAYQEILDLAMYVRQEIEERQDRKVLRQKAAEIRAWGAGATHDLRSRTEIIRLANEIEEGLR